MNDDLEAGIIPMEKTTEAGQPSAGKYTFDHKSTAFPVSWIQACWTGDVMKGIAVKFHGSDTVYGEGDWDNRYNITGFSKSSVELAVDDLVEELGAYTSGFGYGSVRCLHLRTNQGKVWDPGNPGGNYVDFNAKKRVLMGFFGHINVDIFVNSLGAWISKR